MSGETTSAEAAGRDQPGTSSTGRDALVAAVLGATTTLLHMLTAHDGYGLFRDELYYLANAEHPGWGYVDHPPMIGWITWVARHLLGDSMTALRLLPALAAGATVVLACLMARSLGGGRFAQLLAGLATALAPVYVGLFGYLSMNAFDVAFWAVLWLILLRLLGTGDLHLWLPFGVVAGIALENKISPLFLGFGVVAGLVVTPSWEHLRSRWLWLGGAAAGLLFLPHLLWQAANGWPTLTFMAHAAGFKNLPLSPAAFLAEQGLQMSPLMAPVALLGLWQLLAARDGRPYRPLGWALLAILLVMLATRAKAYYFAPTYTLLFAAGAAALEGLTATRGWRLLRPLALAAALAGLALAPLAKPLLPVEGFLAYQRALGRASRQAERNALGRLPQFFADRLGWRQLAETVAGVFRALPPVDQERACVFAQDYGQAGAIDFYGRKLGLPPALSGHNSYFLWGAHGCTGEVVLVIGDHREELEELFGSVELGATSHCSDCMPYESELPVWICRGLEAPFGELWPRVAHYD